MRSQPNLGQTPATPSVAEEASSGTTLAVTSDNGSRGDVLLAWPSNEVMSTMKVGDSFKLQEIANDAATPGKLTLADVSTLTPFAAKDGTVNLEAISADGTVTAFPVQAAMDQTGHVTSIVAIDGDTSGSPKQVTANPGNANTRGAVSTNEPVAPTTVPKACTSTLQSSYGLRITQIGQYYTESTLLATMTFTYSINASSTLGVGVSASGGAGSFKASGTSSFSSTSITEFPSGNVSQHLRSYFVYGKYKLLCQSGTGTTVTRYEARISSFAGGMNVVNVGLPSSAGYCTPVLKGGAFTKQTTTASEWTNGVAIAGSIGVDLSSKTGYSTPASVRFAFKLNQSLCGTDGLPGGSPGRLVARR